MLVYTLLDKTSNMNAKARIEALASNAMVLCAIAITGMMVRREFFMPDPNAPPPPTKVAEWQKYDGGDKRLGPKSAPVRIVEFSDFQCPACRGLYYALDTIRAKYPTDVEVVYRNFPLTTLHPQARPAAIAAQCATDQGHFGPYHDYLFTHQDSLGKVPWTTIAALVGVPDTIAFNRCLSSDAVSAKLRDDSLAAQGLDLQGTPTVLVNAWKINALANASRLDTLITKELKGIKRSRS